MKIHRFIGRIEDEEITRQIRDILKLRPGEHVTISDGKGDDKLVEITEVGKEITYKTIKKLELVEPKREVSLYLAVLKKENFELATQKAVECGVSKIIPVITERTIKTGLNIERLEKIIKEASEQSGRSIVPTLSPISNFKDALENAKGEKIIFHFGGTDFPKYRGVSSLSIFIGPEGGFTEKEVEKAKASGFLVCSLGPLTLRSETAAIIGTYLALHAI
ncbi:16S rRNA (uracil(1498)-N(3))-methyltransferase [Candidatus Nomurabacteria bacterium]|nr:16S rRNA (uracil(1498)-N(3))-methyltransferase [Candidatus Nomurabacteria bacterium]